MHSEKSFSFAEIIKGRDASVGLTSDNLLIAVELGMVISGDYLLQKVLPNYCFVVNMYA
jgi:hypothetical protein